MSKTKSLLVAAVGMALAGSAAQAALSVVVEGPLPPNALALAADPGLAGYDTYLLRVNQEGEHWASADLQGSLSTGQFYAPALGGDKENPAFYPVVPQLRADTFVTTPDVNQNGDTANHDAVVLGGATVPVNHGALPAVVGPGGIIDVAWGDTKAATSAVGNGTWTVAQLTLTKNSIGSFAGRMGGTSTTAGVPFNFTIPIPEPMSASLLALGGLLGLRRRRA
jgi:hypothetical protein